MDEEEDMPLFWLQATNTRHRSRGLRRQASSIFLNSGVFLVLLLVVALAFVLVVVSSIGSFTSQILRPQSIKKSWDSLNLVLVLFAIVCGFLSRNNSGGGGGDNENTSYYEDQSLSNVQKPSHPSTPSHRWFEHQDRTVSFNTLNRLRSFSSYPDLRQESLERWRFYDDTHLNNYRFSTSSDQIHHHYPQQVEETKKQEEGVGVKDIDVDTFVINQKEVSYPSSPPPFPPPHPPPSPSPSPSPSPPLPPSPPPKLVRRKVKRTYQDLGYEKRADHEEKVLENFYNIPPPSPPPAPPPPPPPPIFSKNEKRRGKDFLISLRRKKKKQRQKSVENLDSFFNPQPTPTSTRPLIPPPPPPPPPPHFLQNLFSKKGKTKKLHPVPPPPPPPPVTIVSKVVSQKVTSRTKVQVAPVTSDKPPEPAKTSRFHSVEENVERGNASPLIPLPPPPPLPPFKMPAWKFVHDGDYVRVGSFNSSRSGSPDLDSIEDASSEKDQSSPVAAAGGSDSAATALFCPSPDVNTKADNFIARFRAGLTLEKVNSTNRRSNLGPEASTSTSTS